MEIYYSLSFLFSIFFIFQYKFSLLQILSTRAIADEGVPVVDNLVDAKQAAADQLEACLSAGKCGHGKLLDTASRGLWALMVSCSSSSRPAHPF
jgi:hypothetical protein